ncbi:MAG: hypothetical protein ACPIOQ_84700, partial [Promethearchaeia archaeon]
MLQRFLGWQLVLMSSVSSTRHNASKANASCWRLSTQLQRRQLRETASRLADSFTPNMESVVAQATSALAERTEDCCKLFAQRFQQLAGRLSALEAQLASLDRQLEELKGQFHAAEARARADSSQSMLGAMLDVTDGLSKSLSAVE